MARQSIDCELDRSEPHIESSASNAVALPKQSQAKISNTAPAKPPFENGTANGLKLAPVTQNQIKAIFALCWRQNVSVYEAIQKYCGKSGLEELNIREASKLIDQLKGQLTVAQN